MRITFISPLRQCRAILFGAIGGLCVFGTASAQILHRPGPMLRTRPDFISGFDNRNTLVDGRLFAVYGAYAGVGFADQKLRLKLGVNVSELLHRKHLEPSAPDQSIRLAFLSIGEELTLLTYKRSHFITYANIGWGVRYAHNEDPPFTRSNPIFPIEAGLLYGYDVTDFLRLRAGGGWRYLFPLRYSYMNDHFVKLGLQIQLKKVRAKYFPRTVRPSAPASDPYRR